MLFNVVFAYTPYVVAKSYAAHKNLMALLAISLVCLTFIALCLFALKAEKEHGVAKLPVERKTRAR